MGLFGAQAQVSQGTPVPRAAFHVPAILWLIRVLLDETKHCFGVLQRRGFAGGAVELGKTVNGECLPVGLLAEVDRVAVPVDPSI
jgi:hypothetical protein